MSDLRHVVGGTDGWLRVRREPAGAIVSLPEYVKARVPGSAVGRDQFVALDGAERSNGFSVIAGHLRANNPGYRPGASLQFGIARKQLTFPSGSAILSRSGDGATVGLVHVVP